MLKIFSVYDSKAEAFVQPFFSPATGTAIRSFATACNDENTDIHRYAGDYTLFEIGEFDPSTGKITPLEAHLNLGLAAAFIKAAPPATSIAPFPGNLKGLKS